MIQKIAPSYPITIHIAGDGGEARRVCRQYCQDVGFCVTVRDVDYIYTDGPDADPGVAVGLINYPRFPMTPQQLWRHAEALAERLRVELEQQSYSIEAPNETRWVSYRGEAA